MWDLFRVSRLTMVYGWFRVVERNVLLGARFLQIFLVCELLLFN